MTDAKPLDSFAAAPWPEVDFTEFGEVEVRPLSSVQVLTARYLSRNWQTIPHVTHHEEVDITALDAARARHSTPSGGERISPLAFMVKAAALTLGEYPRFNASLTFASGQPSLALKKYYNIGIAVDTPAGILVPVIQRADTKTIAEIATEIRELAERARAKGLPRKTMIGGTFTISSLGPFGGTAFTPIINAPEVAILGATKAFDKPIKAADGGISWRTMLPLSLSYDHRVLNGADAARFCVSFGQALSRLTAPDSSQ